MLSSSVPKVVDIMKKTPQLNPINIDRLPAHLVDKILTRLPIQDAVRTSMLAQKWRYAWTELSKLVFDDYFCEESVRNSQSKLLRAINQVLLNHRGPLHTFLLSLSNLKSCSEIDQFVLVALRKGVKHFTLHIRKGDPYRLPSTIFAHGQQLELLDLYSCVFKPPPGFKGFSKLTDLALDEVVGISDYEVSSLISNCPLLQCFCLSTSSTYSRLDIDNPNLKFLFLTCLCESICFTNTPKLEKVVVYVHHLINTDGLNGNRDSGKFMLCGKLPAVEALGLDPFYSKNTIANKTPRSIVNDLCHAKALILGFDELFSALCVMRNCQKLEQLLIDLEYVENSAPDYELSEMEGFSDVNLSAPDYELSEMEGFSDVNLAHLKEMQLVGVRGTKCELQFMKLILAKSPVLENFSMTPEFVGEKGLRIFKELSTYPRASPLVEFTYVSSTLLNLPMTLKIQHFSDILRDN